MQGWAARRLADPAFITIIFLLIMPKAYAEGILSQFSKIVPVKTAYLRYAVCGCCLGIRNANCYKSF